MSYKVEHIDTKRLWRGHYPCGDTMSPDGRVTVTAGDNRGSFTLYSSDKGDTWEMIRGLKAPCMRRLRDGTYFGQDFLSIARRHFNPKVQKKIPYVLKKFRTDNFDEILDGQVQAEFCCVDIPDLAVGYGDSGTADSWGAGASGSGAVELDNGDILLPMYGQFKQDNSKLEYFTNYDFFQYRTWVIVSHDGGKNFEYLSTVADCQTYPFTPDGEGFCEAELLDLGGGHVLCAMRTQGHEVYCPLYASHSYDYGKTWSTPEEIAPFGVLPRLYRMESGLILCVSGKWDNFFCISEDDGHTWSERYILSENDGQWDRGPSGYNSVFEVEPGVILIVYDHTEDRVSAFPEGLERRVIYAARYRITKE